MHVATLAHPTWGHRVFYCLWLINPNHKSKCVNCCRYFVIQSTDSAPTVCVMLTFPFSAMHNTVNCYMPASVCRLPIYCSIWKFISLLTQTHSSNSYWCWLHNPLDRCMCFFFDFVVDFLICVLLIRPLSSIRRWFFECEKMCGRLRPKARVNIFTFKAIIQTYQR